MDWITLLARYENLNNKDKEESQFMLNQEKDVPVHFCKNMTYGVLNKGSMEKMKNKKNKE